MMCFAIYNKVFSFVRCASTATKHMVAAAGRVCSGCGCRNHFAVCCKTGKRRVHAISVEQSDSEDEIVNGVTSIHSVYREDTPTKRLLFAKMRIGRELVKLQLDCGASVNLISARHVPAAELTPSTKILQMWDKSLKTPLGECRVRMVNPANEKRYAVLFTVVAEDLMPVLGANACQQMNLITVNKENIRQVTASTHGRSTNHYGENTTISRHSMMYSLTYRKQGSSRRWICELVTGM